jgi:putative transposase
METTEKGIKKFSKDEKLKILAEAELNGVKVTLAKYNLYPATFYYWRKKLTVYGEEGLSHQVVKNHESLIKRLEKENEALKLLLAEKELESRLKDELLKKKYPEMKKKR